MIMNSLFHLDCASFIFLPQRMVADPGPRTWRRRGSIRAPSIEPISNAVHTVIA